MNSFKGNGFAGNNFNDRRTAAANAKKAQLERFLAKAPQNDPGFAERQAERKAIAEAREARIAAREAAKQAALAAERAAREAQRQAEEAERAARAEAEEAERKAARDARYAARKARKAAEADPEARDGRRPPALSADGPRLTLVLGGARSGKSRFAEALVTALPAPWAYIATAEALDEEMTLRIAEHRARRAAGWQTLDAPRDLAGALAEAAGRPVLVDCLTLWLTNLILADFALEPEIRRLEEALASASAPVVLVANEVGLGIVPENALARRFRDEAGRLNQRLAAQAGRVVFMVAGLPMTVKG